MHSATGDCEGQKRRRRRGAGVNVSQKCAFNYLESHRSA
ncbi:hypothetical protein C7S13_4743 [Burkholderia cepacia]|nr:hypothetical protein [Burkholderia cepacia]